MTRLQDWISEFQGDPDYEFDRIAIEIGEQVVARMEEQGMTQADLARAIGVSRARINQILRGNDNLTLKSIVAVAIGLDCRVDLRLQQAKSGRQLSRRDCRRVDAGRTGGIGEVVLTSALAAAA